MSRSYCTNIKNVNTNVYKNRLKTYKIVFKEIFKFGEDMKKIVNIVSAIFFLQQIELYSKFSFRVTIFLITK